MGKRKDRERKQGSRHKKSDLLLELSAIHSKKMGLRMVKREEFRESRGCCVFRRFKVYYRSSKHELFCCEAKEDA